MGVAIGALGTSCMFLYARTPDTARSADLLGHLRIREVVRRTIKHGYLHGSANEYLAWTPHSLSERVFGSRYLLHPTRGSNLSVDRGALVRSFMDERAYRWMHSMDNPPVVCMSPMDMGTLTAFFGLSIVNENFDL